MYNGPQSNVHSFKLMILSKLPLKRLSTNQADISETDAKIKKAMDIAG